jgi:rare lipoprotein A
MKVSVSALRPLLSGKNLSFALLLFLAACAPRKEILYEPLDGGKTFRYREVGMASWYGKEYHGRKTANGEIYNMYAWTAAHPTLPFHTLVRVTNLENGKKADLRINDRGPFIAGRIIDLSYTGAQAIDMVGPGTAKVSVEALLSAGGRASPLEGAFAVQVGAFSEKENAERFRRELAGKHPRVRTVPWEGAGGTVHRVRIGGFRTEPEARLYLEELRKDGFPGIVLRED